jgi:hypothetical protein
MATKPGLFIGTDGSMRRVIIEKKNGLRDYYDLIGTDIVERVSLRCQGSVFEVWCDEEGLMKDPHINGMASRLFGYPLVGNVIAHGRKLDTLCEDLRLHGCDIA